PRQLRLFDRLLRDRRRAGLDRAVGEVAGTGGDEQEERRLDEEPRPRLAVEHLFVEQPGEALHDQDQREKGEYAGRDPDDRAAEDLADFLAELGLGELDLLADEGRDLFGDVEDEFADGLVVGRLRRGDARPGHRAYSGGSSLNTRRQTTAARRVAAMLARALT